MCSMRGSTMSSAKRVWPVTLARPSTRRRGLPMTFMFDPLSRFCPEPPCGFLNGLENLLIARTAAKVSGDRLPDRLPRRRRVALEQRLGGHEDAGGAVAALRGAEVGEGGLQGMELGAARKAFD